MALNPGYFLRESGANLWRNLLMTVATIMTVAVSLVFGGAGLLFRHGVTNANVQYRRSIELTVYMKPDSTQAERDAIKRELDSMRGRELARYTFVDQEEAFEEFQVLFRNQPDIREAITRPDQLPPSYRLTPKVAEQADEIASKFRQRAGVYEVSFPARQVKEFLGFFQRLQQIINGLALFAVVAGVLLILNTIRMAIFARRREVAVMKLVGATNWFIRLPFMLEGLIEGLIGGALAWLALWITNLSLRTRITKLLFFRDFNVDASQLFQTGLLVLLAGAILGTVASAIAVSRFLDV